MSWKIQCWKIVIVRESAQWNNRNLESGDLKLVQVIHLNSSKLFEIKLLDYSITKFPLSSEKSKVQGEFHTLINCAIQTKAHRNRQLSKVLKTINSKKPIWPKKRNRNHSDILEDLTKVFCSLLYRKAIIQTNYTTKFRSKITLMIAHQ